MSKEMEEAATKHMRIQDLFEHEPVRVERAYIAGARWAFEHAAQAADIRREEYHSVLERLGQPEFGQVEFAMGACVLVAYDIRALGEGGGRCLRRK